MYNQSQTSKSKHLPVDISCWTPIRHRFESLFSRFRKERKELTEFMNWDRSKTSRVVNGIEIPSRYDRLKIVKEFFGGDLDTSEIWEISDLNNMEDELNASSN